MKQIITHTNKPTSGQLCAIGLIKILYPRIEIVRTMNITHGMYRDPKIALIGVGREYNLPMNNFHPLEKRMRTEHIPYGLFGLVFLRFKDKLLKRRVLDIASVDMVDENIVARVDLIEQGKGFKLTCTNPLMYLNKLFIESSLNDSAIFEEVVDMASNIVGMLFENTRISEITKTLTNSKPIPEILVTNESLIDYSVLRSKGVKGVIHPCGYEHSHTGWKLKILDIKLAMEIGKDCFHFKERVEAELKATKFKKKLRGSQKSP